MIEREKTYLAKFLPKDLEQCEKKEMMDNYIPKETNHPTIRIRKNGKKLVITKKKPVDNDPSKQTEETIILNKEEYEFLMTLDGKKVHKIRYFYPYKGLTAEIDVFQGALTGLVLVDVEFETDEEKDSFQMPDFCLADVTQEVFIAGGMICGKSYTDIEEKLSKYNYKKLFIDDKTNK